MDDREAAPGDKQTRRCHEAVVAGMTSMVVGLVPFAITFSVVTGANLLGSVCMTLLIGLMVAFPMGVYCGQAGWWLTRNSSVDSRLMASVLAAVLELTLLGWLVVIAKQQ